MCVKGFDRLCAMKDPVAHDVLHMNEQKIRNRNCKTKEINKGEGTAVDNNNIINILILINSRICVYMHNTCKRHLTLAIDNKFTKKSNTFFYFLLLLLVSFLLAIKGFNHLLVPAS